MYKGIKRRILTLSLFIWSVSLHASSIWSHSTNNSREYFVLDDENGIILKHYQQTRGDYQDLIKSRKFSTSKQAWQFIQEKFPHYQYIKKLDYWAVPNELSDKRNKNIWTAINAWNDDWEEEYAKWLQREIQSDFFTKYNISTDCADALIGYRWIFSRIHLLPVGNIIADTGLLFGHFSMRKQWENLPQAEEWNKDKVFLAALNYVMDMTSTRTIMANDGFPVSLTKKGLRAGTFIVSQANGSGHMRTITETYYDNPQELPLYTHSSTAPREIRPLYREAFVDQAWPARGIRQIMAFRQTVPIGNAWGLKGKQNDDRYSEEQFDLDLQGQYYSFIQFLLKRIKESFDPYSLVSTGINDIQNYAIIRIKIVRDGYNYCQNHNCAPGTQGYEDWSTPNRDTKFLLKFSEIEDLVKAFDSMSPGLLKHWNSSLESTLLDIEGHWLSLFELRSLFKNKLASSNPNDPILKRWGLND